MEKSCGIILYTNIERKRYYLLIKDERGKIGFIKGHIEKNETELECALRETWEETSIMPDINSKFYKQIQYRLPNGSIKHVVYYLGYFEKQVPTHQQGYEHFEYLLLTYQEAIRALTHDNTKKILLDAESYLNQGWHYSF